MRSVRAAFWPRRGARVILAVPAALAPLMRSLQGVSAVVTGAEGLPAHDLQAPLMSLMLAFSDPPRHGACHGCPYLRADPGSRHRNGLDAWVAPTSAG